ncbi:hypothetical protein L596_021487 [Steinernema carpocapsae]|uniref:Uncharacterized protein n=1 Tax=Steinernema carpocapsae TaxID=34508 RepID=A0A4U5MIZ1_STECR|nr:hypothetical protein L596_021487 [Steinernema carpocapsae]
MHANVNGAATVTRVCSIRQLAFRNFVTNGWTDGRTYGQIFTAPVFRLLIKPLKTFFYVSIARFARCQMFIGNISKLLGSMKFARSEVFQLLPQRKSEEPNFFPNKWVVAAEIQDSQSEFELWKY